MSRDLQKVRALATQALGGECVGRGKLHKGPETGLGKRKKVREVRAEQMRGSG